MGIYICNTLPCLSLKCPLINGNLRPYYPQFQQNPLFEQPRMSSHGRCNCRVSMAVGNAVEKARTEEGEEQKNPGFKWVEVGPDITELQNEAISRLPFKMSKRCKALMRQIICFSPKKGSFHDVLAAWVRIMKPIRADWLSVLKELKNLEHPFFVEVAEFSLLEESFEANARDYTKIIHYYGKQGRLLDAEKTLLAMKERGFIIDQVTLTSMLNMYSKAGYQKLAEETFQEIRLLQEPLDKRSYGSMIMAYIRARMPEKAEILLREMDSQETYTGSEVYKALLRAYSMDGDTKGTQRVFDAIQIAGISPDAKICGLLINAYSIAGQSQNARFAFENMRKSGIEVTDKCVALVLAAYKKEVRLNEALGFLLELEKDGIFVGREASAVLAAWFKEIGVAEEVELVLREFAANSYQTQNLSINLKSL